MSQASGTATVFGETPQRHPRRWHHPSPVGEHLLGRLGFTNSPGSIPRVLGKGCSYEVFTGLGKRGERGINCGSDGLQLPTALVSCPAPSHPHPHGGAWCLGLPGCPAPWLGVRRGGLASPSVLGFPSYRGSLPIPSSLPLQSGGVVKIQTCT